jgi:hypothetical protein
MVQKTKFLERLLQKWRGEDPSSKGAATRTTTLPRPDPLSRVASGGAAAAALPLGGAAPAVDPVNRFQPRPVEKPAAEAVESRRVEEPVRPAPVQVPVKKQHAINAVTNGLNDLGSLLRGIQGRMENQIERTGELVQRFEGLPAAVRAQIEFLGTISRQLEESRQNSATLVEKFGEMPDLLRGIHAVLEKQAATEARTEGTLVEFRQTMDRIHGAIATLSTEHANQIKDTWSSFERTQVQSVRVFEQTQKDAVQVFKQAQERQNQQLTHVIDHTFKMNRGILLFMVLMFAAVVALFVMLLNRN